MSTTSPDIETVLFGLMCEHGDEPPAPAVVEAWCARFPQHARAIRADVAAWVRCDLARGRVPLHYRCAASTSHDLDPPRVTRDRRRS